MRPTSRVSQCGCVPEQRAAVQRALAAARTRGSDAIHLVPVLFGAGTRLFDHLGGEHIRLATVDVVETAKATHLRFGVVE